MKLGTNIKKIRLSRGLTMDDLALKMNTVYPQVSRWESGTRLPTLEWIIKLAKALDCTPADILGYENLGIERPKEKTLSNNTNVIKVKYYNNVANPDNINISFKLPSNNELVIKKHNNNLHFLDNELNELATIEVDNKEYPNYIPSTNITEGNRTGLPATVSPRKSKKPTKS